MQLSNHCDYEIEPGCFCNQPAAWLALSGDAPEMWLDRDGGNASLASFCTREHALAEPRPNLAAAKRTHTTVTENGADTAVLSAWERALASYPEPVAMLDRGCCVRHWGDPFNAEPCSD